jgi:O-antigen/teichoic acid export membrane protein
MASTTGIAKRSISWVAADTFGTAALSFAVMLVMARLIGPGEFGAAAIAISLVQIANLFVEGLLHDALIQRRDIAPDDFDKALSLVVGLGAAFAVVALFAALLLGGTSNGRVAWLVFGMTCSLPFSGALGIGNARLRRDFRYADIARPSLIGRSLGSLIGVALAFAGAGAWSLIVQQEAAIVLYALLMYRGMSWRPRPRLSFGSLKPLWSFALPQAVTNSLSGLRMQISLLVIASLGGLAATGFLNFAFRLTLTPQALLITALQSLGFPLLAKHQDDREALVASYQHFTRTIAVFVVPLFIGLAICADDLVPAILGANWEPSVPAVRIVACAGVLYFLRLSSSVLLRAIGVIRYSFANSIMHLAVTLGALVALRPAAAGWAAVCWVLPLVPLMPITVWAVRREARLSIAEQLAPLWKPLTYNLAMILAVLLVKEEFAASSAVLRLAASVVTGAGVYGCLLLAFDQEALPVRRFIASRL